MKVTYYQCSLCGEEVHKSKRSHHLRTRHNFTDTDLPYSAPGGHDALKEDYQERVTKECQTLERIFGIDPVRTDEWVSTRAKE
jgi:hypothetical protein